MKNMVYALRINGQIDLLEVVAGTAYGSYKFRASDGNEGTWKKLTGRDATSKFYVSQFGSVQGTVRCSGCHASLNLASAWAAAMLGTWAPNADCYGFEFEGKFNKPPAAAPTQREFDFECYAGEPCFAHMRTHYYPERNGEPYTKIPIEPQPRPWRYLQASYREYIVDRYSEPPRVLGGKSDVSVRKWLEGVQSRNPED